MSNFAVNFDSSRFIKSSVSSFLRNDTARRVEVLYCDVRHVYYLALDLRNGDRRGGEHVRICVEQPRLVRFCVDRFGHVRICGIAVFAFFAARSVGHDFGYELDERVCERQNDNDRQKIENRVEHGELHLRRMREHFFKKPAVIYPA